MGKGHPDNFRHCLEFRFPTSPSGRLPKLPGLDNWAVRAGAPRLCTWRPSSRGPPFFLFSLPAPSLPQTPTKKFKWGVACSSKPSQCPPVRVHQFLFCGHLYIPFYVSFSYISRNNLNSCLWACPPCEVVNVSKKGTMSHNQAQSLAPGWRSVQLG